MTFVMNVLAYILTAIVLVGLLVVMLIRALYLWWDEHKK